MQTRKTYKITFFKIIISISTLCSITACGSLKQVEELGEITSKLMEDYTLVNNDIYLSCVRKSSFATGVFPSIIKDREEGEVKCEKFQKVSLDVNAANSVLFTYLGKLVSLASNQPGFFRPSFDKLEGSLSGLNSTLSNAGIRPLDGTIIKSGFNIVNVLADLFSYGFRASNTKTAILCTNPDIQNLITGLQGIVKNGNLELLKSEKTVLDTYYKGFTPPPNSSLSLVELKASHHLSESYNTSLNDLQKKQNAAMAYIEILNKTAKAHDELASIFRGDLPVNSDNLNRKCEDFFAEGKLLREKASKNAQVTQSDSVKFSESEIQKIKLVLEEYNDKVNPLIQTLNNSL